MRTEAPIGRRKANGFLIEPLLFLMGVAVFIGIFCLILGRARMHGLQTAVSLLLAVLGGLSSVAGGAGILWLFGGYSVVRLGREPNGRRSLLFAGMTVFSAFFSLCSASRIAVGQNWLDASIFGLEAGVTMVVVVAGLIFLFVEGIRFSEREK